MKTRIISIACMTCMACLSPVLSACIDENPAIVLKGFLDPSTGDCRNPSGASSFIPNSWYDGGATNQYSGFLHVENNATTESPWQSSGSSSGSGSTHVEADPSRNAIFVDHVNFDCYDIAGDTDACSGAKRIKKTAGNFIVKAQETANIPISISLNELVDWGVINQVTFKVTLNYHDSGVIRNKKSSAIFFTLSELSGEFSRLTPCGQEKATPPSECSHWGQDAAWECSDDKDTP